MERCSCSDPMQCERGMGFDIMAFLGYFGATLGHSLKGGGRRGELPDSPGEPGN